MRRAAISLVLALALAGVAQAQETGAVAGAYLAARQAVFDGDHREAARYFERALRSDPDNLMLAGNAVLAWASLGNWDRAVEAANRLPRDIEGRDLANLVELVQNIRVDDFEGALDRIAQGRGAGPLLDDLVAAWLHFGEGDMRAAVETFERVATDPPLAAIGQYNLALARAAVGDFEGADAIFSGEEFGSLPATIRGIMAHAQVLVQLDRQADALELLDGALGAVSDPGLAALRDELAADPARSYDFVVSAQQGVAEAFYSVAQALGTDGGTTLPLIYARAARVLDETQVDAVLLSAELLLDEGQMELAAETYESVPPDHPQFITAEMGRSEALFEMGREDRAAEVLQALARANPDLATIHAALGDTLRRMERFEEAAEAYSDALALLDPDLPQNWFLLYARGISYEQSDRWDEAEADFRRALELNPDQPQVLNYLGYSLVEQRRSLDEALDMIERAVAGEPRSGYIVDSLGWVFYRLGRFDEAVAPMERAVELLPTDPIINDHLGDVYWMVGREREAEFQWQRALSFDPEPAEAERIRLKLEIGLTRVLEQEAGEGQGQ